MAQTADQLRQELDKKRDDLTRDIDHLEDKVKATFDLKNQIEQNPLLAAGLSVVGGFLLGSMVGGRKKGHETGSYTSGYPTASYYSSSYSPASSVYSQPSAIESGSHRNEQASGGPGLISGVTSGVKESFRRGTGGSTVEDTLSNVTAALTAILVDKGKEMLDRNLPGFAEKYEQALSQGIVPQPYSQPQPASDQSSTLSRAYTGAASQSASAATLNTSSGNAEQGSSPPAPASRPLTQ